MKKGLSILLAIVMVLSIFTVMPVSVSAAEVDIKEIGVQNELAETGFVSSKTQNEAVAWLRQQNGASYDFGNFYDEYGNYWGGTQCVEFVRAYVNWLVNGNPWSDAWGGPTGNGDTIWKNAIWNNLGWTVYYNTADFLPMPGDIFSSSGVHTGVVISSTLNTATIADANAANNSPYDGDPVWVHDINWGNAGSGTAYGVNYFIRPNFRNPTPSPTNPWIKVSNTSIPTGGSVSFSFGADNATGYTIGIDKNGSRTITETISSGKSYTFNDEGNYSAYVTCTNSAGGIDSSRVNFSVFAPINLGNDFVARIIHSKAGMNIGATDVGNVDLETKSDIDNQKWHFLRQSDNSYKIINVGHDQCLDVANFGTANGTNIGLCPGNDSNAQRYYIRDAGSGYGIVPKVNTDAALDISGGSLTNGANIQEYTWNGSYAQVFSIDYVGLEPSVTKEYNGHTYEYYNLSMPWNQAYRFCESKGGHLVTITEQTENEFVRDMISESVWIGMTCYNNNKTWYWVTGEDFSYNNFVSGQPDYYNGIEFFGEMYYGNGYDGQWNDHSLNNPIPFVCEYDNGDVNADSYNPVVTETIDGITYSVFDDCVDWLTAEAICEAKGGQLVKIDSSAKNTIVNQLANKGSKPEYWINVTDRYSEGSWSDNDGAPLSYTNWADGEPTNDLNAEAFAVIYKSSGKWIDIKGFCPVYRNTGFICESRVPTGITLNKEELSLIIGGTSTLKATVTPTGVDDTVTWKSSNTNVATVTKSGKVTGKSEGYSFVTATTVNGFEATCIVLVGGSENYILGDADEDGEVTIIDATCIQRHLANIPTATYNETAADADEDDEVTIIDATSIQRKLAELPHNNNIGKTFSGGNLPELSGWTDWSTTVPTENTIVESESRTEYRYKDSKRITAANQPDTPDGYSLVTVEDAGYSDWSAWSAWSTERQSADGTLKQEDTTTGYRYYCFACPNCGQRDPYQGACSKCGYVLNASHAQITYYPAIGSSIHAGDWDSLRGYVYINGVMWTYEKPGTDNGAGGTGQPTTTMYRYHTRNALKCYAYQQNDFSPWQTDVVKATDTRAVETRTVYRYRYIIK